MSFPDDWLLMGGAYCATDQWLSRTINGHSLAAAHLGEGPTVVLTYTKYKSQDEKHIRENPCDIWLGKEFLDTMCTKSLL